MLQVYKTKPYVSFTCPSPLFVEIIRINDLRRRQTLLSEDDVLESDSESDSGHFSHRNPCSKAKKRDTVRIEAETEADAILARVLDFDVCRWAREEDAGRGHYNSWSTIGSIYKSATVIFATLSLPIPNCEAESCESLPIRKLNNAKHVAALASYTRSLAAEIERIIDQPVSWRVPWRWPAIALGVAAAQGPVAHRNLVSRCLVKAGTELGFPLPFQANEVLTRFWESGNTGWNDCFDMPYSFFT